MKNKCLECTFVKFMDREEPCLSCIHNHGEIENFTSGELPEDK